VELIAKGTGGEMLTSPTLAAGPSSIVLFQRSYRLLLQYCEEKIKNSFVVNG
jgi:hypothetical protein